MFIDQLMYIQHKTPEVRDAVLIKWLNYVKSENLTEWVVWRKHMMNVF